MTDKQKFIAALKAANGKLEEYEIGTRLGFSDEKTDLIINELLNEGKIYFQSFGLCNYAATS